MFDILWVFFCFDAERSFTDLVLFFSVLSPKFPGYHQEPELTDGLFYTSYVGFTACWPPDSLMCAVQIPSQYRDALKKCS